MKMCRVTWTILSVEIIITAVCTSAAALEQAHTLTGMDVVRATYGLRGSGQTVAVIDTGIAYDHFALGAGFGPNYRVVGGADWSTEGDNDPYDAAGPLGGHGTHVAGIVGGDTGDPGSGVAPGVDMVALRVVDDEGNSYYSWIESALLWVQEHRQSFAAPITTINISTATLWNGEEIPSWATLEEEFAELEAAGVFISVSAGNDFVEFSEPGLSYPAASPHVVAAMSVDDDGQLSYFSQRHGRAIAAPGRSIRTTQPDYEGNNDGVPNDFGSYSGTNFSAPYLAGASVLVREAMELVGRQNIDQQLIYDHLRSTADTILDAATGQEYLRLNMATAIAALMPADDFGSSMGGAAELGVVNSQQAIAGLIGTIDDKDYFVFTAGATGAVSLTTTASHYLQPQWTILNQAGQVVAQHAGAEISFSVIDDGRYWIALSTNDAIGRYQALLGITSSVPSDYNDNNRVDIADYTVWRDSRGSTTNLSADGNSNGVVNQTDYMIWRRNFSGGSLVGQATLVSEPAQHSLVACVAMLIVAGRMRLWRVEPNLDLAKPIHPPAVFED